MTVFTKSHWSALRYPTHPAPYQTSARVSYSLKMIIIPKHILRSKMGQLFSYLNPKSLLTLYITTSFDANVPHFSSSQQPRIRNHGLISMDDKIKYGPVSYISIYVIEFTNVCARQLFSVLTVDTVIHDHTKCISLQYPIKYTFVFALEYGACEGCSCVKFWKLKKRVPHATSRITMCGNSVQNANIQA